MEGHEWKCIELEKQAASEVYTGALSIYFINVQRRKKNERETEGNKIIASVLQLYQFYG